MKLKYIILFILLLSVVSGCSSHGQRDGGAHPLDRKQELLTPNKKLYMLKERLELSDDQVQQMKPVFVEEYKALKALQDEDLDFKEMEIRRSDIEWEVYKKLNKILLEKQMYAYLKFVEEQKKEIAPSSGGRSMKKGGSRSGGRRSGMF